MVRGNDLTSEKTRKHLIIGLLFLVLLFRGAIWVRHRRVMLARAVFNVKTVWVHKITGKQVQGFNHPFFSKNGTEWNTVWSAPGMTFFCRPTRTLTSLQFHWQKSNGIVPLDWHRKQTLWPTKAWRHLQVMFNKIIFTNYYHTLKNPIESEMIEPSG